MSGLLYRLLDAVGRRRALTGWLTAAAAGLALTGGVLAGSGHAPAVAAPGPPTAGARPNVATVTPGRTSLQGIVTDVRPQGFALRLQNGRTVVVRTDDKTAYRKAGKPTGREGLERGARVVVLGKVQPNGRLRARAVAFRGQVPAPKRPAPALPPGAPLE